MSNVTVIMPAYNAALTMKASIDSVFAQTHPDWELLLIVDRNSTDQTLAIAEEIAAEDSRVRLIANLPQGGCAYNRNHGLRQATGDFISFLDSDDLWHPQKLQKQVALMESAKADFSCTGYGWMDWEGQLRKTVLLPLKNITYNDLLLENHIGCLTVMLRRSRFPNLQFVDFLHEDYILWLSLLRQTDAHGLRENLATYRLSRNSRSGNKWRAAAKRWAILRRYEKLPLPRAAWCFAHYAFGAIRNRAG